MQARKKDSGKHADIHSTLLLPGKIYAIKVLKKTVNHRKTQSSKQTKQTTKKKQTTPKDGRNEFSSGFKESVPGRVFLLSISIPLYLSFFFFFFLLAFFLSFLLLFSLIIL